MSTSCRSCELPLWHAQLAAHGASRRPALGGQLSGQTGCKLQHESVPVRNRALISSTARHNWTCSGAVAMDTDGKVQPSETLRLEDTVAEPPRPWMCLTDSSIVRFGFARARLAGWKDERLTPPSLARLRIHQIPKYSCDLPRSSAMVWQLQTACFPRMCAAIHQFAGCCCCACHMLIRLPDENTSYQ